jgi:hypothetical protein
MLILPHHMRSGALIFFLFICFQAVSGKSYVPVGSQHGLLHSKGITLAQYIKNVQATGDNPICKNDDLPDETHLIGVEDDDEDFINRKHLLLSRFVATFSDKVILLYQEHILPESYSFFDPCLFLGSPRYIVHRAIKI